MGYYVVTLRIFGVIILGVALTHATLGPSAEVLLGSHISAGSIADPTIDSQNRFYGVAFGLYGILMWLCGSDIERYKPVLLLLLLMFFLAGLVRLISIALVGMPPVSVIGLMVLEIVMPPVMVLWLRNLQAG